MFNWGKINEKRSRVAHFLSYFLILILIFVILLHPSTTKQITSQELNLTTCTTNEYNLGNDENSEKADGYQDGYQIFAFLLIIVQRLGLVSLSFLWFSLLLLDYCIVGLNK